ncbi:GtrA family protein [Streptomyces sp. NPDC004111]|uniref:GtrA family protein n=1 Tax=Streptomyces sp. NPDC004111 TaxID=3364690 RepID=UPI00367D7C4F
MKSRTGRHAARSRLRSLSVEMAKFGAVGGIGVIVNLLVFNLLRSHTGLPVVRCGMTATAVAVACNYLGFRYFAYQDRRQRRQSSELLLFAFFSAAGLVLENGVLFVTTYGMGWDTPLQENVFKFTGIAFATLFRFWSYRTWVFRRTSLVPATR